MQLSRLPDPGPALATIPALLAPDSEHRTLDRNGGTTVRARAAFVARIEAMMAAVDSVHAFDIDVTDVTVRGDTAEVRYRETVDVAVRAPAGAAPARDRSTTWWRDAWVRTPRGWRALRFEEVAAPR